MISPVQRRQLILLLVCDVLLTVAQHFAIGFDWGGDPVPNIPGEYPAVMIVEEVSDPSRLTYESLTSPVVLDAMDKACPKVADTPQWRKWDKDLTEESLKQAPEQFRLMYAKAKEDSKGQLPWVLAIGKHKAVSAPWPKLDSDALALLEKAGVK